MSERNDGRKPDVNSKTDSDGNPRENTNKVIKAADERDSAPKPISSQDAYRQYVLGPEIES